MKTKLLGLFCTIALIGHSQNLNFEDWSTTTNALDSLDGWSSSNLAVRNHTSQITSLNKSTDAYTGSYAASIQTVPYGVAGAPVIGIMVNGNAKLDFNGIHTSYISGGGKPFSMRPPKLYGEYKIAGAYDGLIHVLLSKYNTTTNQRDTIGFGCQTLSNSNYVYSGFEVPINYNDPSFPDSITIIVYASKPSTVPSTNATTSILTIDHLHYFPEFVTDAGIKRLKSPRTTVGVYDTISAWIHNYGGADVYDFNVSYTIKGKNKVQEFVYDTIHPGDSLLYKFNQIWTPPSSGNYAICMFLENVTNDGNNTNDTACAYISSNLNIEDHELQTINTYPNPTRGQLNITSTKDQRVKLFNMYGSLILEEELKAHTLTNLDLSHLKEGSYMLLDESNRVKRIMLLN